MGAGHTRLLRYGVGRTSYIVRGYDASEHGLTLAHEMKHVLVYERFLREVAASVEAELKARVGEQIRHFASRAEGERELPALIERTVKPLIEAGMREVERRQAAIDTPEEYARLDERQARCLR